MMTKDEVLLLAGECRMAYPGRTVTKISLDAETLADSGDMQKAHNAAIWAFRFADVGSENTTRHNQRFSQKALNLMFGLDGRPLSKCEGYSFI